MKETKLSYLLPFLNIFSSSSTSLLKPYLISIPILSLFALSYFLFLHFSYFLLPILFLSLFCDFLPKISLPQSFFSLYSIFSFINTTWKKRKERKSWRRKNRGKNNTWEENWKGGRDKRRRKGKIDDKEGIKMSEKGEKMANQRGWRRRREVFSCQVQRRKVSIKERHHNTS